jgi:AP endonuclease-2
MGGEVASIAPVSAAPKASASTSTKRKLTAPEPVASSSSSKKAKTGKVEKKGQQSIASFFGKPAQGKSGSSSKSASSSSSSKIVRNGLRLKSVVEDEVVDVDIDMDIDVGTERGGSSEVDLDEDYKLALQLSQQQDDDSPFVSSQTTKGKDGNSSSKDAWTTLLAPTPAPRCRVHNEVAKEFTVNKPGVNKGKRFFICSR